MPVRTRKQTSAKKASSTSASADDSKSHEMAGPAQSKLEKMAVRVVAALAMASVLASVIYFGQHLGVGIMLTLVTVGIFNELVNVAHKEANADREIPWFRTVLWLWFFVAAHIPYTSDGLSYAPMNLTRTIAERLPYVGSEVARLLEFTKRYAALVSLWMYAAAFVATVLCLKKKHLATQLRILSFTVLAMSTFMAQMKMAIHNTFAGLFWFLFPFVLVAVNDTFAYFSGFFLGRKVFGDRTFLTISPNKTWEGFIGGGLCTVVAGFYVPLLLNHRFLTCSFEAMEAAGESNECAPNPRVFGPASLFGEPTPEGSVLGVQYHGMCLAFFASTVAPFGGFFASAIKRAYGLKDFANWIPGHGE